LETAAGPEFTEIVPHLRANAGSAAGRAFPPTAALTARPATC
jgi:hypothetical protein